ncbi:hypothetical protein [Thiomicrorhabdus sp.]|uniref:hypothetical protein n=1 Tax=Thiomicrorhabdus sp. TaxID=2039724 RepID=UPI0029C60D8A|nr:hypothetical protein [Thiomicrorhabdus sp.]
MKQILNLFMLGILTLSLTACNDSSSSNSGGGVSVPASLQNQYTLKYSGENVDGLSDGTFYTVIIGSDSSLTIDSNTPLTNPTNEDYNQSNEITWKNGDYAYVLSAKSDGSFNEINVSDTKNLTNQVPTFKGQFAEDSNVGGTAAIGKAISGAQVTAKCANGSGFEYSVTTRNNGSWSGKIPSASFPCAFSITSGNMTLTSFSSLEGTVNITPLTQLMIAKATAQNPNQWFNGSDINIAQNALDTAIDDLKTALTSAGFTLPDGNFLSGKFSIGDLWDKVLDDLAASIEASSQYASFDELVTAFKNGNDTIPDYTESNNSGGSSGIYDLTITTSFSGSQNTITIENIPKPASRDEFCSVENYDYFQQGQNSNEYSWQVNSCSFSGNEGNISATMNYNSQGTSYSYSYDINYLYTQR